LPITTILPDNIFYSPKRATSFGSLVKPLFDIGEYIG